MANLQAQSPAPSQQNHGILTGVLLVLCGLLFNIRAFEFLSTFFDSHLAVGFRALIVIFQATCFVAGLWLLIRKPNISMTRQTAQAIRLTLIVCMISGSYLNLRTFDILNPNREMQRVFRTINASEDLITKLGQDLNVLNKSVKNLSLPDHQGLALFADSVAVIDLSDSTRPQAAFPNTTLKIRQWQINTHQTVLCADSVALWLPLFERVAYFERAKFKIKKGHFLNAAHDRFEVIILFGGLARLHVDLPVSRVGSSGELAAISSTQTVTWQRQEPNGPDAEQWKITGWRTDSFELNTGARRLFTEVLDQAVSDSATLRRARQSRHEQMAASAILDRQHFHDPHEFFTLPAFDRHPGVAVADLDRDGLDDIYIMARWGENMLLRNRGDGTFVDRAAQLGLDIADHTSSAIFADFDNDGDTDAFLGRTLARSLYLVNDGGRFVDRSDALVDLPLPYFASSVSVVDFNQDGLLDVYVSTYAASLLRQTRKKKGSADFREFLSQYLPGADAEQVHALLQSGDFHSILNMPGPPNMLLRNVGRGRFQTELGSVEPRIFRNTYQSTWTDFDGDGDPDVYLANDFAPNNLLRNDGAGQFVDVTSATGTADIGFGMGASWGDYDNDGKDDLYVTNMYSKAGQRITSQIARLDPRFAEMARGNTLFQNQGNGFKKVSGLQPPALTVENGGWGWGSQFVDIDNDGYLDIYAPSGYYTAPARAARPVDT